MSLNLNGRVVENKAKYINEQGGSKLTYNFVTDPRLKRGHNFGIIYVTSSNYEDNLTDQKKTQKQDAKQKSKNFLNAQNKPKTEEKNKKPENEGVGICTEKVQTTVRPTPITFEEIIQTDPLPPRPQTPLIWPEKTGIDVETQIEDGDLFNFDEEVKPLVHVIASKTIEEARREVLEELELEKIKEQQQKYAEFNLRNDNRVKDIEEKEKKRFEEHNRKKMLKKNRIEVTKKFQQKLTSRMKAKNYISKLKFDVYDSLGEKKVFQNKDDNYYFTDLLPELQSLTEEFTRNDYLIVNKLNDMFTKKKYFNDCQNHENAITTEKNRLAENERIRNIMHEREEEEKRRQKEERARRKHEKVLNALRQQIKEELLPKSEWTEDSIEYIFNINGYYQKGKNVTVTGGPIGQIALTLNYVNKLMPDFLTEDKIPKLIDIYLEKSHPFYLLWTKEDLETYKGLNDGIETIEDIIKADDDTYNKIIQEFLNSMLNNDDTLQVFFDTCNEVGLENVKNTYNAVFTALLQRFKDGTDYGQVRFLEKVPVTGEGDEEIPLLCICLLNPEIIPLDNPMPDQSKNRGRKKFSFESYFTERTIAMPAICDKLRIININRNFDKNYRNNLLECVDLVYGLEPEKTQCMEDIGKDYEDFMKCLINKLAEQYKKEIVEMPVNLPREGEEDEVGDTEGNKQGGEETN